jgi:hypothetical protein
MLYVLDQNAFFNVVHPVVLYQYAILSLSIYIYIYIYVLYLYPIGLKMAKDK